MMRKPYPRDLTDAQWEELAPLPPPAKPRGRPRNVDLREVANGTLYAPRSRCSWRMPPHDFPPWDTVWRRFRRRRQEGVWEQLREALRPKVREAEGREPDPSAAIIGLAAPAPAAEPGL